MEVLPTLTKRRNLTRCGLIAFVPLFITAIIQVKVFLKTPQEFAVYTTLSFVNDKEREVIIEGKSLPVTHNVKENVTERSANSSIQTDAFIESNSLLETDHVNANATERSANSSIKADVFIEGNSLLETHHVNGTLTDALSPPHSTYIAST